MTKWIYQQFSDGNIIVKTDGVNPFHDGVICDVRTWQTPFEGNDALERAKLIASAPDMRTKIAELQENLLAQSGEISALKDKLHRRNMQIAELKNKIEKMNNTIDAIATGKIGR